MEQFNIVKRPVYHLEPGYVYFTKESVMMRAVTGSAVVVCIWDRVLGYGGITQFSYPHTKDPKKATPRYGNVATRGLIRLMEEAGCKRHNLAAQLMGGARRKAGHHKRIGEENVKAAEKVLNAAGVEILSTDVGGHVGRKIAFNTSTGESAVLKVHLLRDADW